MTSINSMSARAKDKRKNAARGERQNGGRQNGLRLGSVKCERISFSWQRRLILEIMVSTSKT